MNFKDNHIFNQLSHNPKHFEKKLISDDVLFTLLWYFVSEQSFAQRRNIFDDIFGGKNSPYDRFFVIWLYKKLELDEFRIYTNNMIDLDNDVDALSSSDLERNLLYIHANGKTIFTSFFDKIRNSIAHGTFNKPNRFFMLGQKSSKPNSTMNFYYQTSYRLQDKLKSVLTSLETMSDINDLCKASLREHPLVIERDRVLYYGDKQIVIEHDYQFQPVKEYGSEIDQIKRFVNEKSYNDTLIILCCRTHGSFKDKDDELSSRNVGIIPYNRLHSFFEYNIKFIK